MNGKTKIRKAIAISFGSPFSMLPPMNKRKKNRSGDTEAAISPNLKVFNATPEGIPKTMAVDKRMKKCQRSQSFYR
ncbi:MAG TPA: hypothetical protein VN516_09870 [Candidatus Baltobacteraceae bacterium]|nr:hypothetical protein [Candidatus Baltobacteraceae bacterium]